MYEVSISVSINFIRTCSITFCTWLLSLQCRVEQFPETGWGQSLKYLLSDPITEQVHQLLT